MDTGIGISNPLFWVGVVESNYDARLEGRIQVRVIGVHGTRDDVPTEDLPWATMVVPDVNFVVPPINSFVFGFFLDGREAQQPMVLGIIPTQLVSEINPDRYGWGVRTGDKFGKLTAQGSRPEDAGQPTNSRLARGEDLHQTYLLAQETNRVRDVPIAGGGSSFQSRSAPPAGAPDESNPAISPAAPSGDSMTTAGKIIMIESGGRVDAQNPSSSAGGVGQFIDSTWLGMVKKYRPDVAAGKSDGEIIGLKTTDAKLGTEMTARYTEEGKSLLAANGLPTDDGALYLHHFLGPRDAVAALSTDPNTPVSAVLSQSVISSNAGVRFNGKSFGSFTTGDLYQWANSKMGSAGSGWAGGGAQPPAYASQTVFSEPGSSYSAKYPHNRVIETPGGHVIEIDDTQGSERIMVWHMNGSYIQMVNGSRTDKSSGDQYDVAEGNHHVYVGGGAIVTIEGDYHLLVKGNMVHEVQGDYQQIVRGNHHVGVAGRLNMIGGEDAQIRAARVSMESNVENTNLKVGKVIRFESTESMHFKSPNIYLEASDSLNLKTANNLIAGVGGKISLASESELYLRGSEIHAKGDSALKIGADTVHIRGDAVHIDDVVNMANDDADQPSSSGLVANSAVSATQIQQPAPPGRSLRSTPPIPLARTA